MRPTILGLLLTLATCAPAYAKPAIEIRQCGGPGQAECPKVLATLLNDGKVRFTDALTVDEAQKVCEMIPVKAPKSGTWNGSGQYLTPGTMNLRADDLLYRGPRGLEGMPITFTYGNVPAPWFADVTIPSPPVRPALNKLAIVEIAASALGVKASVEIRAGAAMVGRTVVEIAPGGRANCLRYNATGDIENFEHPVDATITPAAALAAFAAGVGGFAPKADALAVWMQGKTCLPQ